MVGKLGILCSLLRIISHELIIYGRTIILHRDIVSRSRKDVQFPLIPYTRLLDILIAAYLYLVNRSLRIRNIQRVARILYVSVFFYQIKDLRESQQSSRTVNKTYLTADYAALDSIQVSEYISSHGAIINTCKLHGG